MPSTIPPTPPYQTGSPEIDLLYRNHHRWLGAWLRSRVGNSWDADDLAQDTFVRLLRVHTQQEALREPRAYLATVAGRLVANFFRRQAIERAYEQVLLSLPSHQAPSLEEQALMKESLYALDEMLDGLGPKVKQAFLLVHLENMSYAQVAEQLAVSLRSVKYYIARAMTQCCLAFAP